MRPFIHSSPVTPPIFSGRINELNLIHNFLIEQQESVIIYGNDAIGKSSLVKTINSKFLPESNGAILPVNINAFDFINAVEKDFLSIVVHRICAEIWTKIFTLKYSELVEEAFNNQQNGIKNNEQKALMRIFRIVTSENLVAKNSIKNNVRAKFFIEGNFSQFREQHRIRKQHATFEFLQLLEELNDIIKNNNYTSILVLCDELNHFPEQVNVEILRNYFNIFSSNKIRFLIVSINPDTSKSEEAIKLIESFNFSMEIKPFKDVSEVICLINNSYKLMDRSIIFLNGTVEYLYKVTQGHPWWIQKICSSAYNRAIKTDKAEITEADLIEHYLKYKDEIDIYYEKVRLGLPFRKFDLFR